MKQFSYIIFLVLYFSCRCKDHTKNEIPSFPLLMTDSTTILNTDQIPKGRPTILIFFSPYCEHCQAETEGILAHMDSLRQVQFYFITIDPVSELKEFRDYYHIKRYPNITLGRDFTFSFIKHFRPSSTPYIVVYDLDKKLKTVFNGEAQSRQLIDTICSL